MKNLWENIKNNPYIVVTLDTLNNWKYKLIYAEPTNIIISVLIGLILILLISMIISMMVIDIHYEKHITLEPGYKFVGASHSSNGLYITSKPMVDSDVPESYIVKLEDGSRIYYIQEVKPNE